MKSLSETNLSIHKKINQAQKAAATSKAMKAHDRSLLLTKIASHLKEEKKSWAELLVKEVYKPITFAEIEVERAITVFQWAAAEALRFSGETLRTDATANGKKGLGISQFFPRGVILGIAPFNFPLNLMAHKVAPAIASGNSILIKPSPAAPLITQKMQKTFEAIGAKGLMQALYTNDKQSAYVTAHEDIKYVSFTGSDTVGWMIKEQAWKKPMTLELGGNAWCIVCEDVPTQNLEAIADKICSGAFGYAGQSCISIQNVAVHQKHHKKLKEILSEKVKKFPFGNPADPAVLCGPVIHSKAAKKIEALFSKEKKSIISRSENYTLENGSRKLLTNLIAPTLFSLKNLQGPLVQNEVFGPACNLLSFQKIETLIEIINSGRYGLQTGVFTNHLPTILSFYENLETGGIHINEIPTTRYDHQPYGGVKDSGVGKEGLRYAMEEMCERKFLAIGL